jgi:hypothetical protein
MSFTSQSRSVTPAAIATEGGAGQGPRAHPQHPREAHAGAQVSALQHPLWRMTNSSQTPPDKRIA